MIIIAKNRGGQMRQVKLFIKKHNCPIKREHNLFARRVGTGLTEVEHKTLTQLWLFCPWCGERLAEFTDVAEPDSGWVHIYETDSDHSKAIPAREEYFKMNCDQTILIEETLFSSDLGKIDWDLICPECLLQRRLFSPRMQYLLRGEVVKS